MKPPAAAAPKTTMTPEIASKSTTALKVFYHQDGDHGPRHARYPDINISLTARAHGMSKSQLSRLLYGANSPSLKSLWILSAILKIPVDEVAELYRTKKPKKKEKEKKEKEKKAYAESIVPTRNRDRDRDQPDKLGRAGSRTTTNAAAKRRRL